MLTRAGDEGVDLGGQRFGTARPQGAGVGGSAIGLGDGCLVACQADPVPPEPPTGHAEGRHDRPDRGHPPASPSSPRPVDERVAEVVGAVPEGFVTTYGAVARELGIASPRQVGAVLARAAVPMPWHRVVPATGRLVEGLAAEQGRRLRAEGVEVVGGRVDLGRYRWR